MSSNILTKYLNNSQFSQSQLGLVLRSHAGGYLVHLPILNTVILCQARGRLKKEKINILTGDIVEIADLQEVLSAKKHSALIVKRLDRNNQLPRPPIVNLNQVVLVMSLKNPYPNLELLDKLILHFELYLDESRPILCFNKLDIADNDTIETLKNIYGKLNYRMVFISALTGAGLNDLKILLTDSITVFTGPSGVGKSSLLNLLYPDLALKTASEQSLYGKHTTTCTQLYEIQGSDNHYSWIADTPGFNLEELDCPQPNLIAYYFKDILALANDCKYSNCLHISEDNCNVIANLDKISNSRYESYKNLIPIALEKQKALKSVSTKNESRIKIVYGKDNTITKIPLLKKQVKFSSKSQNRQQSKTNYLYNLADNIHEDIDTINNYD